MSTVSHFRAGRTLGWRRMHGLHRLSPTVWLLWLVAIFVGSLMLGWWLFWDIVGS